MYYASLKSSHGSAYRTLTHELWVVGGGFVRGTTTLELVGEAPGEEPLKLRPYVDYTMVVFNATQEVPPGMLSAKRCPRARRLGLGQAAAFAKRPSYSKVASQPRGRRQEHIACGTRHR